MDSKKDEEVTIRGLKADQLLAWFKEKGQKFVVLKKGDLTGLQPYLKRFLDFLIKDMMEFKHVDGYVLLPVKALCKRPMDEIEALQEIICCYREGRRERGVPFEEVPCKCGGVKGCKKCDGTGMTTVVVEMSEYERAMAEGREPEAS